MVLTGCVDFWKLNKITEVDPELMTMAEDLFRQISGKKYLSKIKSEQVQWNEAQEHAYSVLKEYMLQEPVLKLPDLMKLFHSENRCIWSWISSHTVAGEQRKVLPSRLRKQEVETSRS